MDAVEDERQVGVDAVRGSVSREKRAELFCRADAEPIPTRPITKLTRGNPTSAQNGILSGHSSKPSCVHHRKCVSVKEFWRHAGGSISKC